MGGVEGGCDTLCFEMKNDEIDTLRLVGVISDLDTYDDLYDLILDRMTTFIYPEIKGKQNWYPTEINYVPPGSNPIITPGFDVYFYCRLIYKEDEEYYGNSITEVCYEFSSQEIATKKNDLWRRYQEFLKYGDSLKYYGTKIDVYNPIKKLITEQDIISLAYKFHIENGNIDGFITF